MSENLFIITKLSISLENIKLRKSVLNFKKIAINFKNKNSKLR